MTIDLDFAHQRTIAERDQLAGYVEKLKIDVSGHIGTIHEQHDHITALKAQVARLQWALREIAVGKDRADNEHPMGEWFSMAGRFINIAREALAGAPCYTTC